MVVVSLRLELLIRVDEGVMRRLMPLIKRRGLSNLKLILKKVVWGYLRSIWAQYLFRAHLRLRRSESVVIVGGWWRLKSATLLSWSLFIVLFLLLNPNAAGISNFLGLSQISFINWTLLKNINDNFLIFSWKFVITIFLWIILWLWT